MRYERRDPITWEELQKRITRLDEHSLGFGREIRLFLRAATPLEHEELTDYQNFLEDIRRALKGARLVLVNAMNRRDGRPRLPG